MAGRPHTPPRHFGGGGAGAGSSSLMDGMRRSDAPIHPADPEFSPLGAGAVPAYLVGDPTYDPAAGPHDEGGGSYATSMFDSASYDDATYSTPYGRGGGGGYDGAASPYGTTYDGGDGGAAFGTPGGSVSAFSIEGTPQPATGGGTARRASIEDDYQQLAFARSAGSAGGPDYAGLPTATPPPAADGGPTYMAGASDDSSER